MNTQALHNIIHSVQGHLKIQASRKEAGLLMKLAERYFSNCAVEDLAERTIDDLCGILSSHWQFTRERKAGEAKIRIFNPTKKEDGWETTHTVIQITYDDMPFLVDTTRMVINHHGCEIHFIIHFGGLNVKRDQIGVVTDISSSGVHDQTVSAEALIYIEIDRIVDDAAIKLLKADIESALNDVHFAVADWRKMIARVESCLAELNAIPPDCDSAELAESRDFLHWLINNNFTFLGARDYKLIGNDTNRALQLVPGSGLGVLRSELSGASAKSYNTLPPQARKIALSKNILIIAKTNTVSTVHRDAYTDYIGIKRFNEKYELIGEHRFIGLYTSTAYHSSPSQIPFLRLKVAKVLSELGFPPESHDGKEAVHILETLPRDDLFQATHEELLELTLSILQLKERKRIRLLVRRDAYYRYLSCLVYVPREIFTTELAKAMQNVLIQAFHGLECSFTTYFSDSVLARIHFLVRVNPKTPLEYNIAHIEKWLIAIARSWTEDLKSQLVQHFGEAEGIQYFNRYQKAFPGSYTEYYAPQDVIPDILKMESLTDTQTLAMLFSNKTENRLNLKLFHAETIIILSDILPILENMGLKVIDERPHEIKLREGKRIWIHDFDLRCAIKESVNVEAVQEIFKDALIKIWLNEVENDGFNRLVLGASLTSQEIMLLRAYTKYLRQICFTLSQHYIEQTLLQYAEITRALVALFTTRFDPHSKARLSAMGEDAPTTELFFQNLINKIEQALQAVTSLDEDRIIRRMLELILATTRTNYFQHNHSRPKPYLSLKLNPSAISDLPLPKPKYEIFVYSPRVEGLHLRADKVARGGLRWSDRREDFRTEVLGLMKARQVKNTVIVPEGAKGGFVIKTPPTPNMSRDHVMQMGIACYKLFISGLLDITDNMQDSRVIPPEDVVRYDEDDPYLVVAADKGTATFSDIANSITEQYGFWLGDAFASGGSTGYDHKKIGITSRGVWVATERHFRELGMNANTDSLTVVGIGDMSGDVFGNSMVMSEHFKLIAAFNHVHIFIDPNPDAKNSYLERKRLFALPRSGWIDYNLSLISKGGGIFERSAKSIKLTLEMKAALDIHVDALTPSALIQAILKAPVNLLCNGGIGTFFKSTKETHSDAGDRANDAIRINASELRAKVIAEGGNLGMTQLARIEYSLQGGIVNADFIDNSAGVDCSDHEVNIKILLNQLVTAKQLTEEKRNILLKQMTDEVAQLVLQDNYDQTQIISLEITNIHQKMDLFRHYMNDMEKRGRLDRQLEYLPTDAQMIERKANNQPLTRPEVAILLAYSKMYFKKDIVNLTMLNEAYFDKYLLSAFPKLLCETFPTVLRKHRLRKEIIATQLSKNIIDRMGIHFVERLHQETGATSAFIIKAYVIAEEIFQIPALWDQITALDYAVSTEVQYRLMLQIHYLIRRVTRWLLRNRKPNIQIKKSIDALAPSIQYLIQHLPLLLGDSDKEALESVVNYFVEQKVPEKLARHVASYNALFTALDIIESTHKYDLDLALAAKTYYRLGHRIELNILRELINAFPIDNAWDELARSGFRDDIDRVQRKLTARLLIVQAKTFTDTNIDEQIDSWVKTHPFLMERWLALLAELKSSEIVGFVKYSVLLRELFDFVQTI